MRPRQIPAAARVAPIPAVVIVGAGLAGLATALELAERGVAVRVLATGHAGAATSSTLAQGGVAAALGADDDAARHAADTLAAGAGLVDAQVARRITADAGRVIARLRQWGAAFDVDDVGALRLGLEAAHGRHRIVHAAGDGTGRVVTAALAAAAARHPLVTIHTGTRAARLLVDASHTVVGVLAVDDRPVILPATATVLATGGLGGLYADTTNPLDSWGAGLALGLRAGARVRDLELVQFHPTALAVGSDPMSLVSEAVRGEGAPLVLADGSPAVPDPLAPRDVVARGVWAALAAGHTVYVDGAGVLGERFATRFPSITAACRAAGIDPTREPIPVRPAAHYHMGGLLVDELGRTDVTGLWAVGEVASTGLHGANRLASNSLLEAVSCAGSAAADITALPAPTAAAGAGLRRAATQAATTLDSWAPPARPTRADRILLRRAAGVLRDGPTLEEAVADLGAGRAPGPQTDARLVAQLLAVAALRRAESRGAHLRTDHRQAGPLRHTLVDLRDVPGAGAAHDAAPAPTALAGGPAAAPAALADARDTTGRSDALVGSAS